MSVQLFMINSEEYYKCVSKVLTSRKKRKIIYISINKPYRLLVRSLNKYNVASKDFLIIDASARDIQICEQKDNCLAVSGPGDITNIALFLTKVFNEIKQEKTIIIDALSTLQMYNTTDSLARFMNHIISQAREENSDLIIFSIEGRENERINGLVKTMSDGVKAC